MQKKNTLSRTQGVEWKKYKEEFRIDTNPIERRAIVWPVDTEGIRGPVHGEQLHLSDCKKQCSEQSLTGVFGKPSATQVDIYLFLWFFFSCSPRSGGERLNLLSIRNIVSQVHPAFWRRASSVALPDYKRKTQKASAGCFWWENLYSRCFPAKKDWQPAEIILLSEHKFG